MSQSDAWRAWWSRPGVGPMMYRLNSDPRYRQAIRTATNRPYPAPPLRTATDLPRWQQNLLRWQSDGRNSALEEGLERVAEKGIKAVGTFIGTAMGKSLPMTEFLTKKMTPQVKVQGFGKKTTKPAKKPTDTPKQPPTPSKPEDDDRFIRKEKDRVKYSSYNRYETARVRDSAPKSYAEYTKRRNYPTYVEPSSEGARARKRARFGQKIYYSDSGN